MSRNPAPSAHTWSFFRAGGFDQVRLERGADLLAVDQLDQKLWVALACPTSGLEFDPKTLALIDTDKDGRVRVAELIAALKWTGSLLKNPDDLLAGSAALRLEAINDTTEEGQAVLSSARQVLVNLGKAEAAEITVADVSDPGKIFAQTGFNGDGIIVTESAADDATRALIEEIMTCVGSDTDRSGKPGINQARVDAFFGECTALDAWWRQAESDRAKVLPLGDGTSPAASALQAVRAKGDDFFGRCRLAAFDPRTLAALNREEKEYLAIVAKDLSLTADEVAGFPLAPIAAGRALPLKTGVNPAWAGPLAVFQTATVKPLLGDKAELTEMEWVGLSARLAPYEAWLAAKPANRVESLGKERIRAILASPGRATLEALLAEDQAQAANAERIAAVERLARYHRDLARLCTNFINFKDFYDRGDAAIFQAGTLYLDQRSCELCLRVDDPAKHAGMAALAGTYLAYCDCVRKGSNEKLQIVAAFTDGDSDNLMVGRNGLFYDRKGRDWDATITKIIENPISLRQAFWSPYKKFVRMIEEQIAKRAAAADAASTAKLEAAATATAQADQAKPTAPAPKKVDVGTVAAIGVAFGAIGTFFATLLGYLTDILRLGPMAIVGAIVAVLLLISGPSLIIAYLKLRKRNLGPLLDANGWAVNAKAKVNVPFGKSLTAVAKLPPGSKRDLRDRFAEKRSPWPKLIVLALIAYGAYLLLDRQGLIHKWTEKWPFGPFGKPASAQSAPAAEPPAPATNAPATG